MKFFSLVAIIASAAALNVGKSFDAYDREPCTYHKSEDGTSCVKIQTPCDEEASPIPAHAEDCPPRAPGSARTNTPAHDLPLSN